MQRNIAPVTESTKYTLIWGFLMNQSHQVRESFEGVEGRKACWARVQDVMSKRVQRLRTRAHLGASA